MPTQPTEGMYYDELSKVRVIEPDTAGKTQELKDECKDFVDGKHDIHPLFLSFLTSDVFLIKGSASFRSWWEASLRWWTS